MYDLCNAEGCKWIKSIDWSDGGNRDAVEYRVRRKLNRKGDEKEKGKVSRVAEQRTYLLNKVRFLIPMGDRNSHYLMQKP
jgi:hypothetical protein